MKYYDVTVPLRQGMPVWPGDELPVFRAYTRLNDGDITNSTQLRSSAHIGTHVDAPRHLFNEGTPIDRLPLDVLIGPVRVIYFPEENQIRRQTLSSLSWEDTQRVLFKTRNSLLWKQPRHTFVADFVSLTPDAAEFLVEKGVRLVGIDYLSVDLFENEELPVHKILLGNETVVVEGLNLQAVPEGIYHLICLPLRIQGADGAPARVVLQTIR